LQLKSVDGGFVLQETDEDALTAEDLQVVTDKGAQSGTDQGLALCLESGQTC
jgi:AICAR transformylase/IMP cyclohydrolase PurH